ncbi:uncharacterized protein [Lolium perenne]|uniref:uncharacterized protein n=1 Tax=Lolium perenne TaxID=4522 RepID=UPI0021F64E1C|nr:uncharacterized protein LOC127302672 [Lolium perenne]
MGGRNRRWHAKRYHGGSPNPPRASLPSYPGLPGYDHVDNQCPVPLWEREFCSYVGGISWPRFCENKYFSYIYKEIDQWDDSAAFENFQKAKSRFWSHYHGQPSDIPLPDPDLYIEKVDHRCEVDPELVADLEKVGLPFEADNESAIAANKKSQNQSGNWDIYVEKPAEVNKWEEDNSRSNTGWGVNPDPLNGWNKISSGWGDALVQPSWGSSGNNCAADNWNSSHGASNNHSAANNWSSSHGAPNNAYQDPSSTYQDPRSTYGRKRNGGGYSQQRNSRSRHQAEDYQRGRWQDHRGRNSERFPFDNRPNGQRAERGF